MASAQISSSYGCCPTHWDDRREIDQLPLKTYNSKGEVISETQLGTVVHLPSKDIYGKTSPDSNCIISTKMAAIFFGSPLIAPLRGLLRIGHLFSGQWAWGQGYQEALKSWKTDRRICALNNTPEKAPGRINLYTRVALYSLYRLAEAIAKLITLPIAVALSMLSTLLTVADPLLARRFVAKIEEIWSINLGEWTEWDRFINYLAPCLQPVRVADQLNFYRSFEDYDPTTVRSVAFSLQKFLTENQVYFSKQDSEWLIQQIQTFRTHIKGISSSDKAEIRLVKSEPAAYMSEHETIFKVRKELANLFDLLRLYLKKADLAVDQKINGSPDAANTQLEVAAALDILKNRFASLLN